MMLGYYTRRGWYDPEALQVFNCRQRGGHCWFAHGWNRRGLTAWWAAALTGVLFTHIPGQFAGPLGGPAGGVDIGLPLSLVVAAALFLALLWLYPEPRGVYGPAGARLARTAQIPVPPITGPGAEPAGVPAAPVGWAGARGPPLPGRTLLTREYRLGGATSTTRGGTYGWRSTGRISSTRST